MSFQLDSSHIEALLRSQANLEQLVPTLLDIILELTGAERGFLMLKDQDGNLKIQRARNRAHEDIPPENFTGSSSVIRKVSDTNQALYIPLLPSHEDFSHVPSVRAMKLQSVICIPLHHPMVPLEQLGLLYVDSSSLAPSPPLLGERELVLMQSLANQVAILIQNARLYQELAEKNRTIDALNRQLQQKVEIQQGQLAGMQTLLAESQVELGRHYGMANIVGASEAMQKLFRILSKVVETHAPVLIQGESGTGKELVANYLHFNGPRAEKPKVSINCAAFNEELLESELFGHRKGAFTGADQNKIGLFQLADGGTLFLDEVGDMSLEMQKKLLRVLQDGEVRPIGSKEAFHVDVRIIAASNRTLRDLVQKGSFREDLFFRLNVITVFLPPLRERSEDIPALIDFFTHKILQEMERPLEKIPASVLRKYIEYEWPGNVRELENELRRFFILGTEYQFEPLQRKSSDAETLNLDSLERKTILRALEAAGGNKTRAARLLGVPLRTLYEKLKRL
jgi:serine/threonine-protein kinase PknK